MSEPLSAKELAAVRAREFGDIARDTITHLLTIIEAKDAEIEAGRKQLIVPGSFTSHSGLVLPFKIDCDALSDADIQAIAGVMASYGLKYHSVEGIPTGGLRLAAALAPLVSDPGGELPLIVDDVCTTGRSLEEQRAGRNAIGQVIFCRGTLPNWCRAIFHVDGCACGV